MSTITLQSRRPIYKAGKAIGANTQNVTLNLHDKAVAILEKVCGPNRSQFIRQAIANEIQRVNVWSGLAFRAACKLTTSIKSIFTGTPAEKASNWTEDVKTVEPSVSGGEKVIVEAVGEFVEGGVFIPANGSK